MWVVAFNSSEETSIIKEPIRQYEMPNKDELLRERKLTVTNTFFDAVDLLFNLRGLGWTLVIRTFLSQITHHRERPELPGKAVAPTSRDSENVKQVL